MTDQQRRLARNRLLNTFDIVPGLREAFEFAETVDRKRTRIRRLLNKILLATFELNPNVPPLKCVIIRDSIQVFHSLLSPRNEDLTKFSMLRYTYGILHGNDLDKIEVPSPGFFAELIHLCRGVAGQANLYSENEPAFSRYQGKAAARRRSTYLSQMAKPSQDLIDSYVSGLDAEVIRNRSRNKERILEFFNASDLEWNDWRWHTAHVIRDSAALKELIELTDENALAIDLTHKYQIPFGITPYYVSLMDYAAGGGTDRAVRAQVIPSLHYIEELRSQKDKSEQSMDFMLEHDTSPIEGITRRYPMIVILKPVLTCPQICVYCQRNWEITDVLDKHAAVPARKIEAAISWIAKTEEIREVLVTGGDPFILPDERLDELLEKLSAIDHIERIRIGTRTPVTLPQRITEALVRAIGRFHIPGKREILIVTHFEHPYEITPQAMEAVQKFRRFGMSVYNQQVYTFFTSRRFEACALRIKLRLIGVTPYYTFNTKGKEETSEFRVPIARLLQEQKEETRLLPGAARTDEVVFNVPRLGKNYLRARQHHDLVGIMPNGSRVYEFHPWEKKISTADTYLYTDVSIYDYLKRIRSLGEDMNHYRGNLKTVSIRRAHTKNPDCIRN